MDEFVEYADWSAARSADSRRTGAYFSDKATRPLIG